jgi:hypothetical protein
VDVTFGLLTWGNNIDWGCLEYRMLRIFGPKREEIVGWRESHNVEFHNLYSSPNIITMIHSRLNRSKTVSIMTSLRADNQGIRIQFLARTEISFFSSVSRLALGPTQGPIQWVLGGWVLGGWVLPGDKGEMPWSWPSYLHVLATNADQSRPFQLTYQVDYWEFYSYLYVLRFSQRWLWRVLSSGI